MKTKKDNMVAMLDYVGDIVRALKVGFFLTFTGIFLTVVMFVFKVANDENENNQ